MFLEENLHWSEEEEKEKEEEKAKLFRIRMEAVVSIQTKINK